MANLGDISKIQLPNGDVVNIKDTNAIPSSEKGTNSGVATLDSSGKVPTSELPVVGTQNTYGIVKNGSSVTSSSNYTACPLINGVPYYREATYWKTSTTPKALGTATVGTSNYYSRADHVHPLPANATVSSNGLMSADDKKELIELIDSGAKNKLQLLDSAGTSRVIDGITYTVNSDGSITANGTATAISRYEFAHYSANPNEILSGSTGGSNTSYFIYIRGGNTDYDYNGGVEIATEDVGVVRAYAIVVLSGQTVNNVIFKPMVCSKAAWDVSQKYVPYALPNTKITPELIELVDSGAKNKLPNRGTLTKDNITYTWTNGNVVVSGTKASGSNYVDVMPLTKLSDLGLNDEFVISNNGTNCYLSIIFWSQSQSYTSSIDVVSGSNVITIPTGYTHLLMRLGVKSAATGTISETIQPMICSKAAWDVSQKYVPYAMDNAELTTKKQDKTWTQLKSVTTATDTFGLDLTDKSEIKLVLIYQSKMYEASAPINLINANYKLIVSQVDSSTPNTAIGTLIKNTNDFTATIPSNSYSLRIFAR